MDCPCIFTMCSNSTQMYTMFFIRKFYGKRPLGSPRHWWKHSIKLYVKQDERLCTGFSWVRTQKSGGNKPLLAMPRLGLLASCLSLLRHRFDPRPVNVGFVVENPQVLWFFPFSIIPLKCHTHSLNHQHYAYNLSNWDDCYIIYVKFKTNFWVPRNEGNLLISWATVCFSERTFSMLLVHKFSCNDSWHL